jgi:hypothetical protein
MTSSTIPKDIWIFLVGGVIGFFRGRGDTGV